MGSVVNSVNTNNAAKAGLCPHGVSPGACPVCSGMGGGGLRVGERPQKAGEMSYHECAIIGAMMRAREAQNKLHEQNLLIQVEKLKSFEQSLLKIIDKMAFLAKQIQNVPALKPINFVLNNILMPVFSNILKFAGFFSGLGERILSIKNALFDIQDKLNAVFGEARAFIEKKISKFVSVIKSKSDVIFKIFKRNKTKDDETKIDEDKKIFRLKTFIQKILKRDKHKNNDRED